MFKQAVHLRLALAIFVVTVTQSVRYRRRSAAISSICHLIIDGPRHHHCVRCLRYFLLCFALSVSGAGSVRSPPGIIPLLRSVRRRWYSADACCFSRPTFCYSPNSILASLCSSDSSHKRHYLPIRQPLSSCRFRC